MNATNIKRSDEETASLRQKITGPYGGEFGSVCIAGNYLFTLKNRKRFISWLHARGIDPHEAELWLDQQHALYQLSAAITGDENKDNPPYHPLLPIHPSSTLTGVTY